MAIEAQTSEAKLPLSVVQTGNHREEPTLSDGESLIEFKKYWNGIKGIRDEVKDIIDWNVDFVVFFNNESDREIDWDTSAQYDTKIEADEKRLASQNAMLADAAILEAKDCDPFGHATKEWFRYLLGKAYVFTFQGDFAGAKKMLLAAEQFFIARSKETSRWWYLTASIGSTIPFLVLGFVIWMARLEAAPKLGPMLFWLVLCSVAGAFGALLSVIARSGQLDFDSSAGRWLHYLEAASRIVMGALSGAIVGLAVKSGIFLEALAKEPTTKNSIIILSAFAAGSSERLLGSIISKFDPNAASEKGRNNSAPST